MKIISLKELDGKIMEALSQAKKESAQLSVSEILEKVYGEKFTAKDTRSTRARTRITKLEKEHKIVRTTLTPVIRYKKHDDA